MNWDHIANWKLLSGSHQFPGPAGGTCINEAAIVAAGFAYRAVKSAKDCPPCFSRPIAQYAIVLNDTMPDALRQQLLMPFVMRPAGSADHVEIEAERAELIHRGLWLWTGGTEAALWAHPSTVQKIRMESAGALIVAAQERTAAMLNARSLTKSEYRAAFDAKNEQMWRFAVSLLDQALKIGRQADTLELETIACRMDATRDRAAMRSRALADA